MHPLCQFLRLKCYHNKGLLPHHRTALFRLTPELWCKYISDWPQHQPCSACLCHRAGSIWFFRSQLAELKSAWTPHKWRGGLCSIFLPLYRECCAELPVKAGPTTRDSYVRPRSNQSKEPTFSGLAGMKCLWIIATPQEWGNTET